VTRIALLTGGSTPERDVALAGASQVVAALRDVGYDVVVVDTTAGALDRAEEARLLRPAVGREPPSAEALAALAARELGPRLVELPEVRGADLVFPVLHGRQGEGGALQALLEVAGVPYVGSSALGSAVAMDKDMAKRLFVASDVPTAPWAMWPTDPTAIESLGLPLLVKPVNVGSTVGLTVLRQLGEIEAAVELAARYDSEVMLEAYLPGSEYTVGVLGDRALAVGQIEPAHEVFDYECKYTPGLTRETFPAVIPPELANRLQTLALRAHRALKLRDFSRVDFRLAADGTPMCLEANTLPGVTRTSLLPQSAAAVGIDFPTLCDTICRLGLARSRSGNKLPSYAGTSLE
jgi:D-alanine-D-alanine ligase